MTKLMRLSLPLTLCALLAACGQTAPLPAAPSPDLGAAQARPERAPQQAPEPLAESGAAQMTPLETARPGGQRLSAQALNKSVPLILVHGLGGWGPDEFLGVPYWGGTTFQSVVGDLRARGYTVHAASVGPISSNWERAAELYAQIKGGCVDYGAAYAAKYGLSRFDQAKCYPGFYPEWSAERPVNLLGHSMGGLTARMLVKLLDDGSAADAEGDNLFRGGRAGWVKTVMTLSTPNSGTPATDNLQALIPMLKELLAGVAATTGTAERNLVYDFDLGQWGLRRQAGEELSVYIDRVMRSHFGKNDSNAAYDLSVDGMVRLNRFMGRSPHTVYASWATSATTPGLLTGWAYPTPLFMNAPLATLAWPYPWPARPTLGNMTGTSPQGLVRYDASWWENDGLVPVKSQGAPLGQEQLTYQGGAAQPGQWYALGELNNWDHMAVVGLLGLRDVRPFFRNQADWLASQP